MLMQNSRKASRSAKRILCFLLIFILICSIAPPLPFMQNAPGSMAAYADVVGVIPPSDGGSPPPSNGGSPPPSDTGSPPPSDGGSPPPSGVGSTSDSGSPPPSSANNPPPITMPIVTTSGASGITESTATLSGNILDVGHGHISDCGFVWGTAGSSHEVLTGAGLSYNLTGLKEDTTYYFEAFAANEAGRAYGGQVTFKTLASPLTVTTVEATEVGYTTATLHGNIKRGGILSDSGFNVNLADPSVAARTPGVVSATPGADGSLSIVLDNLKPGVTYNFYAYATNVGGIVSGSTMSFTMLKALPKVETQSSDDINMTSASLEGAILDKGSSEIMDKGFLWGADPKPGSKVSISGINDVGPLKYLLESLKPNTTYYIQAYAANSEGIGYGGITSFKTLVGAPQVETGQAGDITPKEATLNGSITNGNALAEQGLAVTSSGFLWGTASKPDKKVSAAPGTDFSTLSYLLKGLKPEVTYYYQAYATNSEGTRYGKVMSFKTPKGFPEVETRSPDEITPAGVSLNGYISNDEGYAVTDSGFLWGTASKPDKKVSTGPASGEQPFTCLLKDLKPNTTYYIQAYAKNSIGTGYGKVLSFKTLKGDPAAETLEPGDITPVSAELDGNITNGSILHDLGLSITDSGFLWGTGPKPHIKVKAVPGSDRQTLSYVLKNLKPETTYYFQAYATNKAGTDYGKVISFKTENGIPVVETGSSDNIKPLEADLNGTITDDKGLAITESGFLWGTGPKPDKKVSMPPGTDLKTLLYTLKDLKPESTYYFQAYAKNTAGTGYGEVMSFTTINGDPVVETGDADDIKPLSADLYGYLTDNKGLYITDSGFLWGTGPKPDKKVSVRPGTDSNTLLYTLEDLKPETTYYFQAYATNKAGAGYGKVKSFTTPNGDPVVETGDAGKINPIGGTLNASVKDDKGLDITDSGFLWGTDPTPDKKVSVQTGSDQKTLQYILKDLKPEKTYYFQGYATNKAGTGYGEVNSFTTPNGDPVMETRDADKIEPDSASLNGYIKENKGLDITESGFLWGTDPKPDKKVKAAPGKDLRTLLLELKDLEVNTTYYFQAYATNAAGTGYGKVLKFTTATNAPVVETRPAGTITSWSGGLNGFITDDRGFKITDSGFLWGTDPDPAIKVSALPGSDKKTLSYNLPRLKGSTTYYIQAYAVNSEGIGYGKVLSFKTNPPVIPVVSTTSAQFDSQNWQPVFAGSIATNGGNEIAAYGFRYSSDQKNWTTYVVGQDDFIGDYKANVSGENRLQPGTYYVQAWATNTFGWPGFGTTIQFTTPLLPALSFSASVKAPGSTTAVLTGNITDTGGKDITCSTRQFQYRKKGNTDWQNAGVVQGTFGTGEFKFSLEGLDPGASYEFRAQALNPAGWGSSPTVPLTVSWGENDKDAVSNMKAAGLDTVKIAGILKDTYMDTDEAAIKLLLDAAFEANDIASALKSSSYAETYQKTAGLLKSNGFDAITVAGVFKQVYPLEMEEQSSGQLNRGIVISLKNLGYSVDEIASAIIKVLNSNISACVDLLGGGGLFDLDARYGAAIKAYGANAFVIYIKSRDSSWQYYKGKDAEMRLGTIAGYLKRDGNLSASDTLNTLKVMYTPIDSDMAAGVLYDGGYSLADTGTALVQAYGNDQLSIARSIVSHTNYKATDIEEYLIKTLKAGAIDMVKVLDQVMNNAWSNAEIPRMLSVYYNMDAGTAAETMYAAGYKLDSLIYAMKGYYQSSSSYDIIGILKRLGMSAQQLIDKVQNSYGVPDWLTSFRKQGYAAIDYVVWFKASLLPGSLYYSQHYNMNPMYFADMKDVKRQAGSEFKDLVPAGYSLAEIAGAIKDIYKLDEATALSVYTDTNRGNHLGLDNTAIVAALNQTYGVDSLLSEVKGMFNSGSTAIQVAMTLNGSYGITDPEKVADYLAQAGTSENGTLDAVENAFFGRSASKDTVDKLYLIDQHIFKQSNIRITYDTVLRAKGYGPDPANIIRIFTDNGYSIKEISQILKDSYSQSLPLMIDPFLRILGFNRQADVIAGVTAAFGSDIIPGYLKGLKNNGYKADSSLDTLKTMFGITDPLTAATYLAQAGYGENDVLGGLITKVYNNQINPGVTKTLSEILQKAFADAQGNIAAILKAAGATAPQQAIQVMNQGGYTLNTVIVTLKGVYGLTSAQSIDELTKSQLFQQKDINTQVLNVYGGDFALLYVKYWQSKGYTAESVFYYMPGTLGITDPTQIFTCLKTAGFSENDIWNAVIMRARDDLTTVVKNVYALNDPVTLAKKLKEIPGVNKFYGMQNIARGLQKAFPGMSSYSMAMSLAAYGIPATGDESIEGWLRTYEENGKHDDDLAAILGSAHPGDLGLPFYNAVEILHGKGYSLEETTAWCLKDNYSWGDFFEYLVAYYAPRNFPQSYWDNNSMAKYIVAGLKNKYGIDDLVRGDLGYLEHMCGKSSPTEQSFAGVYADLISAGYSLDDSVTAIMKQGATGVSSLIAIMAYNSISRSNLLGDPNLRLSAATIADKIYTLGQTIPGVSISLSDMAHGFVLAGPNAGGFALFSNKDVHKAMELVTAKYLQKNGSDAPVDITALYLLRSGGLCASDAASTLADEGVGLSTGSIIKSMIGIGNDWFDAVTDMVGAGYSITDSVSAVYCNKDYHFIIGVSVLSALATKAVTWLDDTDTAANIIKAIKKVADLGFKVGYAM